MVKASGDKAPGAAMIHVRLMFLFFFFFFFWDLIHLQWIQKVFIERFTYFAVTASFKNGIVPENFTHFSVRERNVISFASLMARRRILLQWKDHNPPSENSWLKDPMSFLHVEKIKCSTRGCSDNFKKI